MKKSLLFIVLISIISFTYSQTFSVAKLDETPINDNDIITFNSVDDDANLVTIITNNGSSAINLNLVAETITGTAGTDMEFCFGACLWGITQGTIYGPLSIDAGVSTGELEVHFHNHSTENDIITYTFKIYEDGNESNAFHFTYKYDANYVGVSNISNNNIFVYPNPVKEKFTVKLNSLNNSEIVLTNILGRVVLTQKLQENKNTVDVSKLSNGVYFYSIINNNKIIETKKLIIK